MAQDSNRYSPYCWVVLGFAWLTMVSINWTWQLVPSLAYQLFPVLDLDQTRFTLIFTAPVLVAVFTSVLGGMLGDRFGIRKVVAVAAYIAALSGLLRAFMPSFAGMFALMCLHGVGFGMAVPNLPKLAGIWFPPDKIGIASGISMSGMGFGFVLGLFTGPLFSDWRVAFITVGIISLVIASLWTIFARSCPRGVTFERPRLLPGIRAGLTNKSIWLVAIAMFLLQGGLLSFMSNFPKALESVHHVDPKVAGTVASLFSLGLVIGNFTLPFFSDRVGLRKPFIFTGVLAGSSLFYLTWVLAPGTAIYVLPILGGIILGGAPPVMFAIPAELPELGQEYVGGASGIIVSMMNLGGFIVPLVVISPLIASGTLTGYTFGFLISLLIVAAIALPALFLRETGPRARQNR